MDVISTDYLSMLGLKLNHVSKRGHREVIYNISAFLQKCRPLDLKHGDFYCDYLSMVISTVTTSQC